MAKIKVDGWDSISEEEKNSIKEGMVRSGAISDSDEIVSGEGEAVAKGPEWDPLCDICKVACDATATAAAAWCTANTAGTGLAVCLAAAESARRECRNRCC